VADTCFRGVPVVIDQFHVERLAQVDEIVEFGPYIPTLVRLLE
jgi:hypothetical protein